MSSSAASLSGRRPEAELKMALLDPKDLPAGLVLVPTQTSAATASSSDPKCATLVTIINAPTAVGSLQHVDERFSGGDRGPFVDQQINELDSRSGVIAEQEHVKAALASCSTLTVTEPGQPPSTVDFRSVPPPLAGENPVAFQATYVSGGATGFEFTQVLTGVDDTVVILGFVGADQAQIEKIAHTAIDRATRVLTGATTGTS
jgi:hypothetical protein